MSITRRRHHVLCALAVAGALVGSPVLAQQTAPAAAPASEMQAALLRDVTNLSTKFTGLARVMDGKYDWRPGQGVRSVADVFNLIVTENGMLANLLTGTTGEGRGAGGQAPITDPAAMQEALRSSYASVSQALAALTASDLATRVSLFGATTSKEGAVMRLLIDQHEHLGQSIAYARTNGVVPPWSK